MDGRFLERKGVSMSSRCLSPGSSVPLAPAIVDSWIPGTSPGMTSELIPPQTAVNGDDGTGDVSGQRRYEKAHEARDILGLAVAADGDLVVGLPLPVLGGVVAADLLGVDAPRRDRVD